MDQLIQLVAPKGWIGFFRRLTLLVGCVAIANMGFARLGDDADHGDVHSPAYYLLHAAVVGGPVIAFFLAVTVYQLRLQRKLWQLSRKDGLTGLNNRCTFFDLMEQAHAADPNGVLLVLDADKFKDINDTYGHQTGDICLKQIAYTLRRSLRQNDIVGRIGGEDYAIYLAGVSRDTARVIGERMTKPIPFRSSTDACLSVTLSIGAAKWQHDISIDAVFARADAALYAAKKNGRARLEVWGPQQIAGQPQQADAMANHASMC